MKSLSTILELLHADRQARNGMAKPIGAVLELFNPQKPKRRQMYDSALVTRYLMTAHWFHVPKHVSNTDLSCFSSRMKNPKHFRPCLWSSSSAVTTQSRNISDNNRNTPRDSIDKRFSNKDALLQITNQTPQNREIQPCTQRCQDLWVRTKC
jgi:hypothetical protein